MARFRVTTTPYPHNDLSVGVPYFNSVVIQAELGTPVNIGTVKAILSNLERVPGNAPGTELWQSPEFLLHHTRNTEMERVDRVNCHDTGASTGGAGRTTLGLSFGLIRHSR
jgi:hypothetical protein